MKKFLSIAAYKNAYGIIYSVSLIPMPLLYGFSSFMYVFTYHILRCVSLCKDIESTGEGQVTQKYIDLLTENIKEEPHGWLWSHKRWKR